MEAGWPFEFHHYFLYQIRIATDPILKHEQTDTIMSLSEIPPRQAADLIEKGAVLVDVREPSELIRERIPNSKDLPLSQLARRELDLAKKQKPVFICRSGSRTRIAAGQLSQKFNGTGYAVTGGIIAWKQAGLPVETPNDPASKRARLASTAATTVAAAGLAACAWGFLNNNTILGVAGAIFMLAALIARNPLVTAMLRSK